MFRGRVGFDHRRGKLLILCNSLSADALVDEMLKRFMNSDPLQLLRRLFFRWQVLCNMLAEELKSAISEVG